MPGGLSDWASPFNNEDTYSILLTMPYRIERTIGTRRNSTIKKKFTCPKQVESFMNLQELIMRVR